ncbi:MAG: hypothetical protein ACOVP7_08490 [Lacibacter sp.]
MQQRYNLTAQKLFLIDGMGAILSAVMLGSVLTRYEAFFGMPKNVLFVLMAVALLLSVYSFTHAAKQPANPLKRLKLIAVANICYCLLTVALMIAFYPQLTMYGLLYFIGELIIILSLAFLELNTAAVSRTTK